MEDFIFNEKLLNKYHNENERRIAREEGLAEGMAKGMVQGMVAQKAEDEKIIQKITEEKDAELAKHIAEIARLKALLQENK